MPRTGGPWCRRRWVPSWWEFLKSVVYTIGTYAEPHNRRPVPHRPGGHGELLSFPAAGRQPQHTQIIAAGARPTSGNLDVESVLPRRESETIFWRRTGGAAGS